MSRRSTSENGSCRRRPYPPSASNAVRGGAPARSHSPTRHESRRSERRAADHRPWWPREYARSSASTPSRSATTGSAADPAADPAEPTEPTVLSARLDRVGPHLARPDADDLTDVGDPDLAVADLAGAGSLDDRVDHALNLVVGDHDLDLHLRNEVHLVLGASVDLGVAALTAEPLDVARREAHHAGIAQGFLDLLDAVRLHDRGDELHRRTLPSKGESSRRPRASSRKPSTRAGHASRPVRTAASRLWCSRRRRSAARARIPWRGGRRTHAAAAPSRSRDHGAPARHPRR